MPLPRTLHQLGALAAIRGDADDATRFAQAAALTASHRIESDADLGPLLESPPPGADPAMLRQLSAMFEAGSWVLLESAIADLPADLRWLYESGAVTIEELAVLHAALGVTSAADLVAEIRRNAVARVLDNDFTKQQEIAAALPGLRSPLPRLPLGRAAALAEPLLERLRSLPGVVWAHPAGSLRRGEDLVGDVELVAAASDGARTLEALLDLPGISRTLHRSARRLYLRFGNAQVGVRVSAPESAGAALLLLTGSVPHVETLRSMAGERGWSLEPEGLVRPGLPTVAETEDAIYAALDLPLIPAEIRSGNAEIQRALESGLPTLVSQAMIRGDLHVHTHWSDGRDSIEAMVAAAAALGYEYLAITDHSPHSAATRNLTEDAVLRQADEIAELSGRFPQIAILHGCEVDILEDGRLDFSDRILQRFDVVLASLHDAAGQAPDRLLRRYLEAMRHPLVTMITHPANRLVPHRRGYELDYDRLFEAARETGTVVEIDGAPSHLDLEGALARRAAAAGAALAIDSDAHRADVLGRQMQLGVMIARRGWIEPHQVLNTRPIEALRAHIAAKRGT